MGRPAERHWPRADSPASAWTIDRPSDRTGGDAVPTARLDRSRQDLAAAIQTLESESSRNEAYAGGDIDKSYVIPGLEIVAFEFLLNQYDRNFVDRHTYSSDDESIRNNLKHGWVIDKDPFRMNQFGHPYAGSIYHGFARSAGLDYWESLAYDFAGSALWEVAGETDPPSANDQITTSFAGSFLGEALFRTAHLVLGDDAEPGFGREAAAALICPSAAINRHAFGERFARAFAVHDPATFYWFGLGARRNTTLKDLGVLEDIKRGRAAATVALDYGLPGKPGYAYDHPFDYFHLETTATSSPNAFPESIMVRGLLYGSAYESGQDYKGIWGLYGSYDYFSPEIFKVSSTALSLGTTGQYLMSDQFALQGTAMGGFGFTAVGNTADSASDRQYRYGFSPQALVSLRLVYDDVAMFDVTAHDYLVSGHSGSSHTSGSENVLRAQVGLTVRVYGPHALGLQFVQSTRDPRFSGLPNPRQTAGALSVFYTFLSDESFGVIRR